MTKVPISINFTDFHAHLFKDYANVDSTFETDRFKAQLDTLHVIFNRALELNVPVIFGGDLFHKRVNVDTRVFNAVFQVFAEYTLKGVNIIMVRGNHDSVSNSIRTASSLDPFNVFDNIVVATTPETLTYQINNESVTLHMLPYGEEIEEMKTWLQNIDTTNQVNILVGHIGVDGATVGTGSHSLGGSFTLGDLRPTDMSFVYLGHYHKRQDLADNVIYGGNTIQTSFSDEGQVKGYHILYLDTETKEVTAEFVEIPNKMFISVEGDNIPNNDILKNNYIRFVGTKEQAEVVNELKDQEGFEDLRVVVKKDYNKGTRLGIVATDTESDVVRAYVKSKGFSTEIEEKALTCMTEALDSRGGE